MVRLGIVGYGNLGKACEEIAVSSKDFELTGIFTRRNPQNVISKYGSKVYSFDDIFDFKDGIDVLALCVGSQCDLVDISLCLSNAFNTVDSFDTHLKMTDYYQKLHSNAVKSQTLHYIGIGWDPGIFSLMRAYFSAILPSCDINTFWGRGVSQGHSEAIRKIDGVIDAKEYTVPIEQALQSAREGNCKGLKDADRHTRECYVVLKECENQCEKQLLMKQIQNKIVNMPDYFLGYQTEVHFVDKNTFYKEHNTLAHGGEVIASADVCDNNCTFDFSLRTKSNPHLTASVLLSYAKCNAIRAKSGDFGVKTVLDIPISHLLAGECVDKISRFI